MHFISAILAPTWSLPEIQDFRRQLYQHGNGLLLVQTEQGVIVGPRL